MAHREGAMRKPHRIRSRAAGPAWGLVFAVLMTAAGTFLWFHAKASDTGGRFDESVAVASILIGVFVALYAGREMRHDKRR
jgi:drug/metabolite transporter (DMT)-like permease